MRLRRGARTPGAAARPVMLFGSDRTALRRTFVDAWDKRRRGVALQPLEARIADVVAMHPEYHALMARPDSLDRDFAPEAGLTNPFLHMAMHVALAEQRGADRPVGVALALDALARRAGDAHAADHEAMECLGQALWEAQRAGRMPDDARYLDCLRARARRRGR